MKIGMLTYYGVHNYGAVLQMYALQKVYQAKGLKPLVLKFERNYSGAYEKAKYKYEIGFRSLFYYFSWFYEQGIRRFFFNLCKYFALWRTRKKYFEFGDHYMHERNLDYVSIGSDEVFAVDVGVNPFFYGNDVPCDKVFSYAACFGKSVYQDVVNCGAVDTISSGLKKLCGISVRDENSRKIVESLIGRNSPVHCDPVLLYGFNNEIREQAGRVKLRNYCVVYSYDENVNKSEEKQLIQKIASDKGLKIVSVGFYHEWCDLNIVANPISTLGYFANAEFVITDTFHGTIFSIITHRKFATLLRGNKNKVAHLLLSLGLESRMADDVQCVSRILNENIDYQPVDEKIDEQRKLAHLYLDGLLGGAK